MQKDVVPGFLEAWFAAIKSFADLPELSILAEKKRYEREKSLYIRRKPKCGAHQPSAPAIFPHIYVYYSDGSMASDTIYPVMYVSQLRPSRIWPIIDCFEIPLLESQLREVQILKQSKVQNAIFLPCRTHPKDNVSLVSARTNAFYRYFDMVENSQLLLHKPKKSPSFFDFTEFDEYFEKDALAEKSLPMEIYGERTLLSFNTIQQKYIFFPFHTFATSKQSLKSSLYLKEIE